MKIGMVAPLIESCPPKLYGGTERIVTNLCNSLVNKGYDVTLFASGDSHTNAKLVPLSQESLRLAEPHIVDPYAYISKQLDVIIKNAAQFDIIHNHNGYQFFPFVGMSACPLITTLHGRLDLPEYINVFQHFHKAPLISISYSQRKPLPTNHWIANVYHGIDATAFQPKFKPGKYLAFLGRVSIDKGIEKAIEAAKIVGIPLKIAAKIDKADEDYYKTHVKHLIDGHHIEYVGEISEKEKSEFLNNAIALMFPVDWPEPFGLAAIEAYACGTPVITRPFGSLPEIVEEGKTGFIRLTTEELSEAVGQVHKLDRKYIRKYAEERFSSDRMADDYIKVYQQAIESFAPQGDKLYATG